MVSLYSKDEKNRMKKRAMICLVTACAVLGGAFSACIVLCAQVRTANAERLLYWVIGLFTLAGWAFILLLSLGYWPYQAEYRHMEGILNGPEEMAEGRLTVSPATFRIPKSIVIRKAALTSGEETKTLNVDARLAKMLPKNGSYVRIKTVRKYITAAEVARDENV